jgi:hypothetical protein
VTYSGQPQELPGIVADLAERLRALEARFLVAGPQGPTGPAGSSSTGVSPWLPIKSALVTPGLSPVASVNFPIPLGFHHVVMFGKVRTDAAVTNQALVAQFNGDTGANYYWEPLDATNTTVAASGAGASTSIRIGIVPGANATANIFGGGMVTFPFHADAHYKHALAHWNASTTLLGTGQQIELSGGFWANAAPISSVLVFPSAGGLITDSTLTMWGIV